MRGFKAQLVEHRTGIAEVTGSNPVEALIFSGFFFPIEKMYCHHSSQFVLAMFGNIHEFSTVALTSELIIYH